MLSVWLFSASFMDVCSLQKKKKVILLFKSPRVGLTSYFMHLYSLPTHKYITNIYYRYILRKYYNVLKNIYILILSN